MSSSHYNPWPLGKLPIEFQRPEPQKLLEVGYSWEDPRDIVGIFESKLAAYAGARFAVLTDSCSNALFLSLRLVGVTKRRVEIPANTYVSVPLQIYHAGGRPVFVDQEWSGIYQLGNTNVWDSAARFTKGMYVGGGALQCLSFQIKKRLPIGRGGAILTDSEDAYHELKLLSYDGRNLETPYTSDLHVTRLGWHMYMTPEDAARGVLLMDMLPEENEDTMDWRHYPDLRLWRAISQLSQAEL
jgi:dTDP-4-amino-4,6-dideoxygalactose transaminase